MTSDRLHSNRSDEARAARRATMARTFFLKLHAADRANGIQIEYEEFGERSAPAILLIMGLGGQLIHWPDDLCRSLAGAGYRVIRYDNRDVGLSSKLDDAAG